MKNIEIFFVTFYLKKKMSNSLLIKNGTVVTADSEQICDVLVTDGKIEKIGENLTAPNGYKIIDATGKFVLPGGIDPHTHIEMPLGGFNTSDDWVHATRAAAAGGTTTIFDFIPIDKGTSHCDWIDKWEKVASKSTIDYSLHMSVVDWNDEVKKAIEKAIDHGINSAKCYLAYKGRIMLDSDQDFLEFFSFAAKHGMLPMAHCEDGEIITYMQKELISQGKTQPKYHPESRPAWCEGSAAKHATAYAAAAHSPLYIVHNTCIDSLNVVEHANDGEYPVIGETTILYLTLTKDKNDDPDFDKAAGAVCSPPLRTEADRQALWSGLRRGALKTIATDHCPIDLKYKRRGVDDFRKIPNGCPAIEERMVLAWSYGVDKGLISPSEYVALTSTNAAKIFGLYPRKGTIAVGSDADIIILDPKAKRVIKHSDQKSLVDYNLWEGQEVTGIPIITISNGRIIWEVDVVDGVAQYKDGKLTAQEGEGHFLPRKPFVPYVFGRKI